SSRRYSRGRQRSAPSTRACSAIAAAGLRCLAALMKNTNTSRGAACACAAAACGNDTTSLPAAQSCAWFGQRGVIRRIGEDGRYAMCACQIHIAFAEEADVAHFQHMPQRPAVQLARQAVEEGAEVIGVEWPRRRQLPQDRAQPVAHLGESAVHETADALAGIGQPLALRDVAWRLQREDE